MTSDLASLDFEELRWLLSALHLRFRSPSACFEHLAPLAGGGPRAWAGGGGGTLREFVPWRLPLTLTLSPQAGRGNTSISNWLPRIRHRGREAAVDRKRLAVDVGRLVARQKQSHRRDLVRLAGALQRIELADLVLGAAILGAVEDRLGHAGLDQAGADGIDAYAGAGKRIGRDLHQADHA